MLAGSIASIAHANAPVLPGSPVEDPSGHALDALERAIRVGAHDRTIRIVHLGDSHVAADIMTGALRQELQDRFGDGGPGLFLPGLPWPNYRHQGVETGGSGFRTVRITRAVPEDGPIGLTGAVMIADEPGANAWFEVTEPSSTTGQPWIAEVHYLKAPEGGRLQVKVDDRVRAQFSTAGNRVEAAFWETTLEDGPHRVELIASGGGPVRINGVSLHRTTGLVYDAVGINGARLSNWRRADPDALSAELARMPPALIVTTFGTNEIDDDERTANEHKTVFLETLAILRASAPGASCLVMGPPDRAARTLVRRHRIWQTMPQLGTVIAASRQAALESGCAFWDTYQAMGGRGSIRRWALSNPPLAGDDHVHMTSVGYRRIADAFASALMGSL